MATTTLGYSDARASHGDRDSADESTADLHKEIQVTWKGRIWDTFDLPPKERKLLFKVDALILTFAALGYFLKNLDQTNVNNAFLSGMKEDLGMFGNQLVTSTSIWTVGYVIGQIPSNLLLTRVSPRFVIPSLELGWGIFTLASYSVKSYKALYAIRFFVGLFESGFYPGIHYLLGGWYTPREIGKRAMIFWLAGSIGQMFSGFLQAAAYTNLNGRHGLAGWRWLFIIDAIITIPIAIFGFFFLPGLPLQDKKEWWLTEEENQLAIDRLRRVGRKGRTPWTKERVKTLLTGWHFYVLPLLYVIWNNGYPQAAMGFYLKSFNSKPPPVPGRHYTVAQINNLPLPATAIFIAGALTYAWLSDGVLRGRRWPFIYAGVIIAIPIAVALRVIPLYDNIKAHFALYWISNVGQGAGPLIMTWINEICSNDSEKRSLLVAMGNDLAYVVQAVGPLFYWKTTDFPAARKGWTAVIIYQVLLAIWTTLILFLLRRDRLKAERDGTAERHVTDAEAIGEDDKDVKSQEPYEK
ncbi:Pantothenate transporter liz1 [Vanrija pseudolonga]|uniref:Pantothenate transporter liz1 n=1 Tax=Vanrija pseudolonga TaxID=143232 RepID=A0AAF0Y9B3_9TREE|nr:Pantothenate transporter liz1 [Vanrija pseudolonga]